MNSHEEMIESDSAAKASGGGESASMGENLEGGQHDSPPSYFDDLESGTAAPQRDDQPFRIMGYNNGVFYYFPLHLKQVVALTPTAHTIPNLCLLAPYAYWEKHFGIYFVGLDMKKHTPPKIAQNAMNFLMGAAIKRGVFQLEEVLRGTGIWQDDGRMVINCGNKLYVDLEEVPYDGFNSKYTYSASVERISPATSPLTNKEANKFLELCQKLNWTDPTAYLLLAGWTVIAPFCASLSYRPHLYITGETDSGKSTVINEILKPALGSFSFQVEGGTTEPAIRQHMGYDARPIIFDEAEGETGKQSIAAVLELARKASTGATVMKYGQNPFKAQFSICFSAINPPVDKSADENRISFLVLKKNRRDTAIQEWEEIKGMIKDVITPDFSGRLLQRSIVNFAALAENIEVFQLAARRVLKAARTSKQIGALLAGAYSLGRAGRISIDDAEAFIRKHHWDDITPIKQDSDPVRLVQHICSYILKYTPVSGNARNETVGSLIGLCLHDRDKNADNILRQYAIKVTDTGVSIGDRSPNLAKIMRGTDWEKRWNRTLSDIPFAAKISNDYFMRGVKTNAVRLPLELFKDDEYQPTLADHPDITM